MVDLCSIHYNILFILCELQIKEYEVLAYKPDEL